MPHNALKSIAERRCDALRDFNFSSTYEIEARFSNAHHRLYDKHRVIHIPFELRQHLGIVVGAEMTYMGVGEAIIMCSFNTWKRIYAPMTNLADDERALTRHASSDTTSRHASAIPDDLRRVTRARTRPKS